jgi:hypothetical protein
MEEWLSDRERGGFYASQDADDSLEDDGDYFTWSRAEAREVLTAEEFEVAAKYFNLRDVGDMHHDPRKCVLHIGATIGTIAEQVGGTRESTRVLLETAAAKMYAVLETAWVEGVLKHVVAYGEGVEPEVSVPGVLEDYAFVANAALDAWEATGEIRYFNVARAIGDAMIAKFYDAVGCGFFDTEKVEAPIGVLGARRKPLQDAPTPAGNSVAATVLLRLAALTGEAGYTDKAQDTLEAFAGIVEHFGLYAASYGLALRRAVEGPVQVCLIGENVGALEAAAMRGYAVNRSVVRVSSLEKLPPALAETLPHLPVVDRSVAVVCKGTSCLPPVAGVEELVGVLV